MMSARRAWFSTVEYRPNPVDGETGVIGLGFLIEFTTDKYWVVSAVLRAGFEAPQLTGLDDLAKQVIQHRSEVIAKEINRVLPFAHEPGQALSRLAASNPWSLHLSEPREIEVTAEASDASVERIQEEYAYSIYWTRWLPAMQAREVAYAAAERERPPRARTQRAELNQTSAARIPADVLPPWLLPPASVIRPLERAN